jgi:hypothetical protein
MIAGISSDQLEVEQIVAAILTLATMPQTAGGHGADHVVDQYAQVLQTLRSRAPRR